MTEPVDLDAAARFILALTSGDGWNVPMFFQTFDDGRDRKPCRTRTFSGALREHASALVRLNRDGACVAVAINQLRGSQRLLEEVVGVRALFIDCDGPRTRPLALPTSITVESRAGRHYYWLLRTPSPPRLFAGAQRQLAEFYGSDAMVCDATRVMRLPGFDHRKESLFRVRLVRADPAIRYSIDEILAAHPVQRRSGLNSDAESHAEPQNEGVRAFRAWAAAAPRLQGARNATAFAMAAAGFRSAIPPTAIAREVHAYCERAGIPGEANAVLRSAARHVGRPTCRSCIAFLESPRRQRT